MWMCSGLNNQCVESTNVLDIVVSFNKSDLKHTCESPGVGTKSGGHIVDGQTKMGRFWLVNSI